ncbi:MAG: hypothetical protein ACOYJD_06845 [Christensenellales bacterium]
MKLKRFLPLMVLALLVVAVACSPAQTGQSPSPSEDVDAVTTASMVADEAGFIKAIGADGVWIICLTEDIETSSELTLEGEFSNGRKDDDGKDILQRKIALYAQDNDRNVTDRYTLTAPQITIKSPEASMQRGTFVGDIYVESSNFQLVDMKVEGNVYFLNADAEATFQMDDTSTVSGVQELKE